MHKPIYILITLLCLSSSSLLAQELNARMSVNASQVQGSNKEVFEDMQKNLTEFLNSKNWTNHVYSNEERIECNFLITINQALGSDEFKGTIQITSNRPGYGSGYSSPMLNIMDKNVQFRYTEGETLEFTDNTHNELTSLIAYYVYVILAYDYDSFAPKGGTEFFEKAQQIVTTAQSSRYPGWKSFEDRRNRYWLVENNLNSIFSPLRNFSYTYHRKGLDKMSEKTFDARSTIATALPELLKVHRKKPNSMAMMEFFTAKSDEIISVLSESQGSEAQRAINILKEVDETNANEYDKIVKKQ